MSLHCIIYSAVHLFKNSPMLDELKYIRLIVTVTEKRSVSQKTPSIHCNFQFLNQWIKLHQKCEALVKNTNCDHSMRSSNPARPAGSNTNSDLVCDDIGENLIQEKARAWGRSTRLVRSCSSSFLFEILVHMGGQYLMKCFRKTHSTPVL